MTKKIYKTGFILKKNGIRRLLTKKESARYDKRLFQAMKVDPLTDEKSGSNL